MSLFPESGAIASLFYLRLEPWCLTSQQGNQTLVLRSEYDSTDPVINIGAGTFVRQKLSYRTTFSISPRNSP